MVYVRDPGSGEVEEGTIVYIKRQQDRASTSHTPLLCERQPFPGFRDTDEDFCAVSGATFLQTECEVADDGFLYGISRQA